MSAPQPMVRKLFEDRFLRGRVLLIGPDVEADAAFLAANGLSVVAAADGTAADARKAAGRVKKAGADVPFHAAALPALPADLGEFDHVIDTGSFARMAARKRAAFVSAVTAALQPLGCLFLLGKPAALSGAKKPTFVADEWTPLPARRGKLSADGREYPGVVVGAVRIAAATLPGPTARTDPPATTARAAPAAAATPMTTEPFGPGVTLHKAEIPPDPIAAAQECPNWCWAAALQMLCKSQGATVDQKAFVEKLYGKLPNGKLPCLPSGTLENIRLALKGTPVTIDGQARMLDSRVHNGPPSDPQGAIRSILDGRPFILGYQGHAFVCYGIWWLQQPPFVQVRRLLLIDPLWKLVPSRPQKNTFDYPVGPAVLAQINGTLELVVG